MSHGRLSLVVLLVSCGSAFWSAEAWAKKPRVSRSRAVKEISGREIFLREWLPNDPRSHGGDGLGPVFNDTSCVACHNQGGIGGGGAEGKNVQSLSAVFVPSDTRSETRQNISSEGVSFGATVVKKTVWDEVLSLFRADDPNERQKRFDELKQIHPGLATSRSVILHKSGTDAEYAKWRTRKFIGEETESIDIARVQPRNPETLFIAGVVAVFRDESEELSRTTNISFWDRELGNRLTEWFFSARPQLLPDAMISVRNETFLMDSPIGFANEKLRFQIQTAQRNTTALFGAGLIDSIPGELLEKMAAVRHEEFPQVTGRIARLKDGKIGRFGWKAQKANLHDFTMTACAVELGLHVPDHAQAGLPHKPDYKPTGYDLDQDECAALVQFLRDLPAPQRHVPNVPKLAEYLSAGEKLFAQVGCAVCHMPQLGEVNGLYSDLLLHDMGPELLDSGSYGVFQPDSPGEDADDPLPSIAQAQPMPFMALTGFTTEAQTPKFGAAQSEWRTPPLWGVRDSAPYLHDGRAKSLEQAIAMHGGEGVQVAINFFRLTKDDQTRVLSFLRTLVAPDAIATKAP